MRAMRAIIFTVISVSVILLASILENYQVSHCRLMIIVNRNVDALILRSILIACVELCNMEISYSDVCINDLQC